MVFSSIPFLFYFLPIVLTVYFLAPAGFRNAVLLLASLLFYAWGEPRFVPVLLFSILQGYIFGLLIEKSEGRKAKVYMAVSLVLSLGILGICKYANFFVENFNAVTGLNLTFLKITLPVGISFYTFQMISYVVDVYTGKAPAQKNFVNLAAYIAMFPQLVAGPIVRYTDIEKQLTERVNDVNSIASGIRRFVVGLSKKVLIANVLGELCAAFKLSTQVSVLYVWLYAVAYALHIYYDFSGYSDMAIGLGRILGFSFTENFNYPFVADSATDFWRRWHISLGSWFRDYVYIPMGGNRVTKKRWFLNIMTVWMLTGFWHGASWNFVLWGLFFGILLMIEKLFLLKYLKKAKVWNHIYLICVVLISFILFDSLQISDGLFYMRALVGLGGIPFSSMEAVYMLKSFGVLLAAACIGATPLLKMVIVRASNQNEMTKRVWNILEPALLLVLLVVVTAYLVDGSFNPFLYFRF